MTIVVAGPGVVYSDSLDSTVPPWYGDKAWRMHGYIIAVCGSCGSGDQRLETDGKCWPKRPTTQSLINAVSNWPQDCSSEAAWMVVTRDRVWTIEGWYVYPRKFPCAIGCGAPWALGRLDAAPTELRKAVAFAIRNDQYCGGAIREVKL